MSRLVLAAVAAIVAAPSASRAAPPRAEEELVEKVRKAIDRGVNYLRQQEGGRGNWEGIVLNYLADQEGGATSLCTLALLNCGVRTDDRTVARALDYLRTLPPKRTYVVGITTMVFAEARQPKDLPLIQRNVDWIIDKGIGLKQGKLEGWSYPGNSLADNSNTQYALLGLYAGKQAGAKIDDAVWKEIQAYYTRTQQKASATSGYWKYHNTGFDTAASFTMTVAGVCGLYIAGMGLGVSEQGLDERTGVAANCGVYAENGPLARGMNWIASNFSFEAGKSMYYNIYGLERLGRLSGQRFIGRFDWYRQGCEFLVRVQNPDGSITSKRGIDGAAVVSTSFGLLFLSKGRTPVLVSKFAWGDYQDRGGATFVEIGGPREGVVNWNRKHNDARNVVDYASRELFKGVPLAWQVYDVRRQQDLVTQDKVLAEVGVLLSSPVVYLNGHGVPRLSGAQRELLKRYVEEGGFVFAEACCGDKDFARGFRSLMKELFPENELKKVPPEHPVWRAFADVSPADFPELECLERGCKTVVIFSPTPLAGYWEEGRFMPEKGRPAKNEGERAFRLAGNVIAYATGLELPKPRLFMQKVEGGGPEKNVTRSQLQVAQLRLRGADSEPAPAAVRNLMAYLRDAARLEVRLDKQLLYPGDDDLYKFKFLYLHGRRSFTLDDYEMDGLRAVLQTGGLLFADAACGKPEFDKAFREQMAKLFPESKLEVIPPTDPIFSAKVAGSDLTSVRVRREKPDGTGPEAEMRNYPPLLEGIKIDGRWAVVYSKYDVGCALEGARSSECLGHDKESALRLASAVVLYALKR